VHSLSQHSTPAGLAEDLKDVIGDDVQRVNSRRKQNCYSEKVGCDKLILVSVTCGYRINS
jgi:hypothetical protein